MLKGSASMCENAGLQFLRTTTGIQSEPDALDEARLDIFIYLFFFIFLKILYKMKR